MKKANVSSKANELKNLLQRFLDHPDKGEIIAKLCIAIPADEISEWLKAKYNAPGEKKFAFSSLHIKQIQENYLDIYNNIQEDLNKANKNRSLVELDKETKEIVQGNSIYKQKLDEYLDHEIDIKKIVKNLVVVVEHRASQLFDAIQADPQNIKMDRTLIEWFNTLTNVLEKYDNICNGISATSVVNNNHITVQVMDQHLAVFQNVIKNILSRLDYETSLLFIDIYNQEMSKLKEPIADEIMPIDIKIEAARKLEAEVPF